MSKKEELEKNVDEMMDFLREYSGKEKDDDYYIKLEELEKKNHEINGIQHHEKEERFKRIDSNDEYGCIDTLTGEKLGVYQMVKLLNEYYRHSKNVANNFQRFYEEEYLKLDEELDKLKDNE